MSDESDVRGSVVMSPSRRDDDQPRHSSPFTPAEGVPYLSTPRPVAAADEPEADSPGADAGRIDPFDEVEATVDRTPYLTDPRFPVPPERASLDEDDLVPLVARHTDDTATIDLIAVLQAQLQLRAAEAAGFAAWENRMRRIGTDEAFDEIEKTRLRFTDVIPTQGPAPVITVQHLVATTESAFTPAAPDSAAPISAPAVVALPGGKDPAQDAPVVSVASVPLVVGAGSTPARPSSPIDSARRDAELLEHDPEAPARVDPADTPAPTRRDTTRRDTARRDTARAARPTAATSRVVAAGLTVLALVVVAAAFVVSAATGPAVLTASLAAVGVVAAAWLGLVAARLALRPLSAGGRRVSAPVTPRTPWALVAGLVAGSAVGEGMAVSRVAGFSWLGYLTRLVEVHDLTPSVSLIAASVVALVVSFAVVVVVDRAGRPSADR